MVFGAQQVKQGIAPTMAQKKKCMEAQILRNTPYTKTQRIFVCQYPGKGRSFSGRMI